MSRQTTRAFAAGLATTALALWLYQQTSGDESLHVNELKRQLEEKNYIVLTAAEAEKLLGDKQAAPAEERQQKDESIENAMEENSRQSNQGKLTESENEPPPNDTSFTLTITAGMSATEIGQTLEKAAIINSASQFSEYLTTNGYSTKVQVGQYKLSSSMTLKEIAAAITKQ